MIELTVRTLDSQNHPFTVEDDITVEQFKVKIAETVNIPAETQRIIYCGRVLNDSSKLSEYDVNGKVVHLVQRAPPNQNQRPSRTASPQRQRRGGGLLRGFEHGNAMYLGSMAFPSNLMESQGFIPPPPTHSLAGSRLNVAKRMLRRAEGVLRLLENPNSRSNDQTPPEENQDEEVTPVIEARVIVPNNTNEPIDPATVLSVVQNSLFNATGRSVQITREENETGINGPSSTPPSNENTPESSTPRASSTENLDETRSDSTSGTSGNGNVLAENASRTSEMAELLTMLGQLQTRFAPFLDRYMNFMQEDPIVPQENARQTQMMLTRVSEVMHLLGHAYHSLSDIIVRVRTPPPRPLLCRPILIQHSAVVQAGIPIQLEINVSTDRPPSNSSSSSTATTTTEPVSSSTSGSSENNAPTPTLTGSFPFMPAMRVQSFPIEIRSMQRPNFGTPPQNNNNTTNEGENATSTNANVPATTTSAPTSTATSSNSINFNNSNVEFFMEVTPEVLRGALNGPPPELIQSLMQMAGRIMDRSGAPTTSAPTTESTSNSSQSNATSSQASQAQAAGQNSQARGNTQTNPTTSTHTRSTPRPHVHLAQQAMQAGFDPFLPCNSHHVTTRRVVLPSQTSSSHQAESASRQESTTNRQSARIPNRPQTNIYNFISDILGTIRNVQARRGSDPTQSSATAPSANAAPTGSAPVGNASGEAPSVAMPSVMSLASLFQSYQGQNFSDMLREGPTIYQLLQRFNQEENYVPGENTITDFIMLLLRNLTIADLYGLSNGNEEPLSRCRNDIQSFFRTRALQNDTSPEGIERAVERLIVEMRAFIDTFALVPTKDNIDLIGSVEKLLRTRIPVILNLGINLNPSNVRTFIEEVKATVKYLCAMVIRSCSNGQPGVEQVLEQALEQYLEVPPEVRQWTYATTRIQIRQYLSGLSVPDSTIEEFLVYKTSEETVASTQNVPTEASIGDTRVQPQKERAEAMELDDQEQSASGSGNEMEATSVVVEDTEPLPNIVLGSEPWHAQVPADWVPIIARDAQKQRRQSAQGPFSDAYLSGMPSKRRKIVNSSKPHSSLPQVISESIRQAVTSTGLSSAAPLDSVVQAAGESIEIQTAYRNLLRTNVQATLRDNQDFTPERYPNASNYFNNPQ